MTSKTSKTFWTFYASVLFVLQIILYIVTVLACWYLGGKSCYDGAWLGGIGMILIMPAILIWSFNFGYTLLLAPALYFIEKNEKED